MLASVAMLAIVSCTPTSGGTTPTPAPVPHGHGSGTIALLHMVDAQTGWGWSPHLLALTSDSARTFSDRTPAGIESSEQISAVDTLDSAHAWVVVATFPAATGAALYRTADGGASWIRMPLPDWGRLHFIDRTHGWLLAEHPGTDHRTDTFTLFRTVDRGVSWTMVYRTTQRMTIEPSVQLGDCQWTGVTFATPARGFAGMTCPNSARPQMDVTSDGGSTWHQVSLPAPPLPNGVRMAFTAWQPVFGSGVEGSAFVVACIGDGTSCRFYGALDRTVNGGRSWVSGPMVFAGGGNMALLPDGLHGWLPFGCLQPCGHQTVMLRTDDGGRHWTQLSLPDNLGANRHGERTFDLASPTVGFATSIQELESKLRFYRTNDGGATFTEFTPKLLP